MYLLKIMDWNVCCTVYIVKHLNDSKYIFEHHCAAPNELLGANSIFLSFVNTSKST